MALFFPTAALETLLDVTPELLRKMDVDTILLDVDNTMAFHGSQEPFPGTVEWSRQMRKKGFRMMILSNNFAKRVAPFAAQYDLPFLAFSVKPFPLAYFRAIRKLGAEQSKTVIIGDQVFTDVVGANLSRMKSILLTPRGEEKGVSIWLRRVMERPVRRRFVQHSEKKGGDV